jgi:prolyl oligopeptidase
MIYPETRKEDVIENYHGIEVHDPYRWLENVDSPDTLDWVKRQNELTFGFLSGIPARERIRKRLTELWDFPKAYTPHHRGHRYFQLRNSGLQNQDVLFVFDALDEEPRILLDPNTLAEDGTAALSAWSVSKDGNWLAYAVSRSGSDWKVWHIRNVTTGEDLPEILEWSKFSGAAWAADHSGFYYGRYPKPEEGEAYQSANYNQKLYFHKLNTSQDQDICIYERPDQPEWGFDAGVTDDGHYLLITVWHSTDVRNRFFYKDLQSGDVVELIPNDEATYGFIHNDDTTFYFLTNLDAPRNRLIAINTDQPEKSNWKTLIPEKNDVLESVKLIHEQFVALYMHDAHEKLERFDKSGRPLGEIILPTLGAVAVWSGRREDTELFYLFHSFVHPLTVYRYDFERNMSEVFYAPPLQIDVSSYQVRQVFVSGKDETKIPMFLIHRNGLKLDGSNPTLLYGYGGFNISLTPAFDVSRLAWFEMGGVLAVANLRGGGEYGEEWHQAGMIHNKQNVFDDFIACAEWLIDEKITSTPKLGIEGGSNGGLLVGACMTQRPDLFGACLPAVGVMDMLRFHKFTIGWAWVSDYGSAENADEFKTLYAYSPYHNLKPNVQYPATLVTTADHDDRVVPGHSFKFAARLQECQSGSAPTLIRIQTKAGHGMGKPTSILIEELADIYAFLVKSLGILDQN